MKIFIWKDVLRDYTDGLAVGYGETLEDVLRQFPDYIAQQLGSPTQIIDCESNKSTMAIYVYGGG